MSMFFNWYFFLYFFSVLQHRFSLGLHQEGCLVFKKPLTAQTQLANDKGQAITGLSNLKREESSRDRYMLIVPPLVSDSLHVIL